MNHMELSDSYEEVDVKETTSQEATETTKEEYTKEEEMEIQENTDSSFSMNLDVLNRSNDTISYLGDIYGYQIFSEEFESKMQDVKEEERSECEEAFANVLTEEKQSDVDEAFSYVMQGNMQVVVKGNQENPEVQNNPLLFVGGILLGMVLTLAVFFWIEQKRKEKHSHEHHVYHDYSEFE
ncbi:MAG: hypothetical protein K6C69_04085 [Lachnospiraceae bacterium]|nr:hypothetical protein [Lachnospiraceae bacterium]